MGLIAAGEGLCERLRGARLGPGVTIGAGTRINAAHLTVGPGTHIGRGVHITADRVTIGADSYIGDGSRIAATEFALGYNGILVGEVTIHSLATATFGAWAKLSRNTVLKAPSITVGCEFWMNRGAEIGGGAWRTGTGSFTAGDRCHLGRNSHLNTAEAVTLGDDTAVGMDCVIATHANWQPVDAGYVRHRAPVTLGEGVAVYTRSVIAPGVRIDDGGTVAAGAVVVTDVPARGLVGGVPARLIRTQQPQRPATAVRVEALQALADHRFPTAAVSADATGFHLDHRDPDITVLMGPDGIVTCTQHQAGTERTSRLDLPGRVITGTASPASELLREHLFAYGFRFRYGQGYQRAPLRHDRLLALGIEE